jgi:hypothetical protein
MCNAPMTPRVHSKKAPRGLNSIVNEPGYSRHNVGVTAFLLLKYGGVNAPTIYSAAEKVAAVESENPFFEYVVRGPNDRMLRQILTKCRLTDDGQPHPRFQWIWERRDKDKSDPAAQTMYWDCLFVANLYKGGPLPGTPLPTAMEPMYKVEQAAFDAALTEANRVIESI